MIHATHDQVGASTLGDRAAMKVAGAVHRSTAPHGIDRRPAGPVVARFAFGPARSSPFDAATGGRP